MDDYPYWAELPLVDQLWIVSFQIQELGLPVEWVHAIRETADRLEGTNSALHLNRVELLMALGKLLGEIDSKEL